MWTLHSRIFSFLHSVLENNKPSGIVQTGRLRTQATAITGKVVDGFGIHNLFSSSRDEQPLIEQGLHDVGLMRVATAFGLESVGCLCREPALEFNKSGGRDGLHHGHATRA